MEKRPALGKGLSALIPDTPAPAPAVPGVFEVDVDRLSPNDYQPRHQMDDARLEELSASIRANGVIQPIVVRKSGDGYRIIAGERRWRAAQRAGLSRVPVVVKDIAGDQVQQKVLEMALIENIQREDLNAIDEAKAYRRLVDEFGLTQDAVAGGSRQRPRDRRQHAAAAATARRSAERRRSRRHRDGTRARPARAARRAQPAAARARGEDARPLGARDRSAREAGARRRRAPRRCADRAAHGRRAHARRGGQAEAAPRHARADQAQGQGGRIEIDFSNENELIRIFEALTET